MNVNVNATPLPFDAERSQIQHTVHEAKKSSDERADHSVRQKRGCIPGYTEPGGCAPHQQNEYLSPPNEYIFDVNIAKSFPADLGAFLFGS